MEAGLQEPLVILDLVPEQVLPHLGDVYRQAVLSHGVLPLLLRLVLPVGAVLVVEGLGQLLDVVPVVAVLGEGVVLLPQHDLHIAGVDGHGELVDLVARVIDVELPPHVVARPGKHAGQGVAQHAAPGVADVHGASGVGGDELHHHLFTVALVHRAVGVTLGLDVGQHLAIPLAAQSEVQKAGASDLHLVKEGARQVQVVHNGLGDLPRGLVEGLGPRHGKGGGVVAVGGVLGDLDGGLHLRAGGQQAGCRRLLIGRLGQLGDLVPGRLDHIGHLYHLFFKFFRCPGPSLLDGQALLPHLDAEQVLPGYCVVDRPTAQAPREPSESSICRGQVNCPRHQGLAQQDLGIEIDHRPHCLMVKPFCRTWMRNRFSPATAWSISMA